jgi:hypothetical protein
MRPISCDPRWDEYTTCTAAAPNAVFTVHTYGDTTPLHGPGLVRRFIHHKPRNRRSAPYARRD